MAFFLLDTATTASVIVDTLRDIGNHFCRAVVYFISAYNGRKKKAERKRRRCAAIFFFQRRSEGQKKKLLRVCIFFFWLLVVVLVVFLKLLALAAASIHLIWMLCYFVSLLMSKKLHNVRYTYGISNNEKRGNETADAFHFIANISLPILRLLDDDRDTVGSRWTSRGYLERRASTYSSIYWLQAFLLLLLAWWWQTKLDRRINKRLQ